MNKTKVTLISSTDDPLMTLWMAWHSSRSNDDIEEIRKRYTEDEGRKLLMGQKMRQGIATELGEYQGRLRAAAVVSRAQGALPRVMGGAVPARAVDSAHRGPARHAEAFDLPSQAC